MPPSRSDVLKVCALLSQQEELNVTVKESFKAGLFAFTGAFAGGLLGGPVGIAVGGTAGSLIGARKAKNVKPVAQLIQEDLTERQKNELADAVRRVIQGFDSNDVYMIMAILAGNTDLRMLVVKTLVGYVTNELRYELA